MKRGTKLNEVFDRLKKMLDTIESIDGIDFATSSKYGYVTSCPSNLGTGMRASVHVKICVEINPCVGCTPSSRRRVDGVEVDAMNAP